MANAVNSVDAGVDLGAASVERRSRSWKLWHPGILLPLLALAALLTSWEIAGRNIDPLLFAPPSRVLDAYVELISSGRLWAAFLVTVNALGVGFLLAVASGVLVGIVLGRRDVLARLVEPYVYAVYSTPSVVLIPLIIVWFGVGYSGRVFIVWLMAFIPIMLETAIGVRDGRRDLVEVGRCFGASEVQLVRHVIMPAAVPYVMAGLRIGAGRAIVGVLLGELFLDLTGLGGIIQTSAASYQVGETLAAVLVYIVMSVVLIGALGTLERRLSAWKES